MEHRRRGASPTKRPSKSGKDASDFAELIAWDELESWQQDNEYILRHYRRASYSVKTSVQSVSGLHNETGEAYPHVRHCVWANKAIVNIWTHGLGSLLWVSSNVPL